MICCNILQPQHALPKSASAYRCLRFSPDASTLAVGSVDGIFQSLKLPISKHYKNNSSLNGASSSTNGKSRVTSSRSVNSTGGSDGVSYCGHSGLLHSLYWSHSVTEPLLLSSAGDGEYDKSLPSLDSFSQLLFATLCVFCRLGLYMGTWS